MRHYTHLLRIRFTFSVIAIYAVTLLFLWAAGLQFLPQPPTVQSYPLPSKSDTIHRKKITLLSGKPVRLIIPSLNLDKQIEDGIYNASDQTWNVSPSGVHYATISNLPNNNSGTTLLYGHNNKWTLGNLYQLKPGDTATITTSNNLSFTYRFQSANDFQPTDTSIFDYKGNPTLTVQTCSGAWNESRRLHVFDLVKVESTNASI